MTNQLTFFVPGPLPGLNDVISWAKTRINWLEKGKNRVYRLTIEKEKWDARVDACATMAYYVAGGRGAPKQFEGPVGIRCTWYEKNRSRDPDNIFAGVKFILDGLVKSGVLANDGQKWVKSINHYLGPVNKDRPGVLVNIAEI